MTRNCPACPGLSWDVPREVDAWWEHVQSVEHEAARTSSEGRGRITAFWARRDAEKAAEAAAAAGMLFQFNLRT